MPGSAVGRRLTDAHSCKLLEWVSWAGCGWAWQHGMVAAMGEGLQQGAQSGAMATCVIA